MQYRLYRFLSDTETVKEETSANVFIIKCLACMRQEALLFHGAKVSEFPGDNILVTKMMLRPRKFHTKTFLLFICLFNFRLKRREGKVAYE